MLWSGAVLGWHQKGNLYQRSKYEPTLEHEYAQDEIEAVHNLKALLYKNKTSIVNGIANSIVSL